MKLNVSIATTWLCLIGIMLLILKMFGIIKWNWIWVLTPFWLQIPIIIGLFIWGRWRKLW